MKAIIYLVIAIVLLGVGFKAGSLYQALDTTGAMKEFTYELCATNKEKENRLVLKRLIWTIRNYKETHSQIDTTFSNAFFVEALITSMEEVLGAQALIGEDYELKESTLLAFSEAKALIEELGGAYPYDF